MNGKVVKTFQGQDLDSNNSIEVDVSNVKRGIYSLEIISANKLDTHRIILE